ncbi:MAG: hypothetical protein C0622_05090 [Desulfuromonas sp.]|nr:MAG: hypothetical protein C0622_05090 [Desulfuromonas sp.]
MNKFYSIIILTFILSLSFSPLLAFADECTDLKQQIRKEKDLLKQEDFIFEALDLCEDDPEVHYLSGYYEERLRFYNDALEEYLMATELDKGYAKAYFGQGDVYMVLGNIEAAIDADETGLSYKESRRARASLELAQIKRKAETGGEVTSEEIVRVMQEDVSTIEPAEGTTVGPILRMQIQFRIDSSQLSETAKAQLETVAAALLNDAFKGQKFEISGHTDSSGAASANLTLSKERAEQVKKALVENYSVPADKLVVAYYGDTRPAVPNTSAENRAINRRVEFKKLN